MQYALDTVETSEKSAATRRGELLAEQILRSNDNRLLREMTGDKCCNRQISILRYYDRAARRFGERFSAENA